MSTAVFTPKFISFDCYGTLTRFRMTEMATAFYADRLPAEALPKFCKDWGAYRLDEVLGAWKPYRDVIANSLERCSKKWGVEFRASDADAMLHFNETSLMGGGKRVMGILEGDSDPQVFIPQLIEHHVAGRYPFDRLVEMFSFDDINAAFEASESGRVIKPVLKVSAA